MSTDHGFDFVDPKNGAGDSQGEPSPDAKVLINLVNQKFAELTKQHKSDLKALGATPEILAGLKKKYGEAAEAIKDLDAKVQAMARLQRAPGGEVDEPEAEGDQLWEAAVDAWIRQMGGVGQMSREQVNFVAGWNEHAEAEQIRKAHEEPVAFDPQNAVSAGGLQSDFGPGAGVWARPTFEREVTRQLVELTPIRSFARVVPIGGNRYEGVIRNTNRDTIEQIQEGTTPTQQTQKDRYQKRVITPYEYAARPALTRVQIEDSVINLVAEVQSDLAFDFAEDEANQLVNGSGANEPHGYAVDTDVTGVTSRTASAIDHYDLTNLAMNLRPFYRSSAGAAYSLSTDALTDAMLEEDGFGRRLWQPSNQAGMPSLLNGFRFFEAVDQAAVATAAKPVFFANWSAFYRIVDRRGMLIIRDEVTTPGLVILNMTRRYGGRTWLTEAGRALTVA